MKAQRVLLFCLLSSVCAGFLARAQSTPDASSPASATSASARRRMAVEDLWAMERVGAPVVSPDGQWAVFVVTAFSVEKNKGNGDLWLVPTDGSAPPKRLTWNEESDSSPAWSPDGRSIAFVSKRGSDKEKAAQLHLLPLEGGEAQALTDLPISPADPKWSPDGKRIYFTLATFPDLNDDWEKVKKRLDEQKDDKTKAKISESRLFRAWDVYVTDGTASHLFALDLSTKKVRDLTPNQNLRTGLQGGMTWDLAADGREITFVANSTPPPFQTMNFDLYALALDEAGAPVGSIRNLTAGQPADESAPRYSPDGAYVYFTRTRRQDIDPDFARLARLNRLTGEVVGLLENWDVAPDIADFTVDSQGKAEEILLRVEERGRTNLYAARLVPASPEGISVPRLLARGGSIAAAAFAGIAPSADGKGAGRVVFARGTMLRPAELFVVDLAAAEEKALSSFNAARMAAFEAPTVEEITVPGAGGHPVHAWVVLPPDFKVGAGFPLMHMFHGGPHGAWNDDFGYRWSGYLFASKGYVVVQSNFHGSTGYGQKFTESILGAHGDKPFVDVEAVTDAMVAKKYVDPKRLFGGGGSYGGYLTAWVLGHTDRYAALVNHAGVYDLMAQYSSDFTWGRSNNYGATPWQDPQRIVRWSPSYYAKNFRTPTLVLHGEKDFRVPVTQGINLYHVLQAKGVPTRIVVFPDENHWILKPQSSLLWTQEFFAWLERFDPARKK